jgi:APA family basic amino acid/polyamine antiporter
MSPGHQPDLPRRLGGFDATMVIVGDIVGIGIFTTTGLVADACPHPLWILAAWLGGGLLTLCGALTIAELGSALPRAGGEYVYLKETYGPLVGFLNGWTYLTVTSSGSIAAMAVALAGYVGGWFPALSATTELWCGPSVIGPVRITMGQVIGVGVVLAFSAVNYVGLQAGRVLQDALTVAKLAAILAIAAAGLLFGRGSWSHFSGAAAGASAAGLLPALGVAASGVLFSYSGWFACTYVAGEIRQPERNIPRSLFAGTLIVTALYLAVNVAYLYALPVGALRGVVNVGEAAATSLFGRGAAAVLSATMAVTILSSINSVVLTSPRIYYAMARDGLFFRSIGAVHPRFETPTRAILLQAVWASLLVLTGSFGQLLAYVTVAMVVFSLLSAGAVIVLRWRRPDLRRPYRTPLHPWLPLAFIGAYGAILAGLLASRPREALYGLAVVASGLPVYWLWSRRARLVAGATGGAAAVSIRGPGCPGNVSSP